MDIETLIKQHQEWKEELRSYLKNPDGKLKCEEVEQDNLCEMGRWIYGEGMSVIPAHMYQEVVEKHKRMHLEAGRIIRRIEQGKEVTPELALNENMPLGLMTVAVYEMLGKLREIERNIRHDQEAKREAV